MPIDDYCGFVGRCLVLILGVAGITLSIVSSANCQFLHFQSDKFATPSKKFVAGTTFQRVSEGYVGIFSYQALRGNHTVQTKNTNDLDVITNGCVPYENIFMNSNYESLTASQFCAVFAPILSCMALLVSLIDTFCCSFTCSFLLSSGLFLLACAVQAGTFSLFAQPEFCLDSSGNSCDVGLSVYLSATAVICFWSASTLLCCFPIPRPLCCQKEEPPLDIDPKYGNNIVVQPVIIDATIPNQNHNSKKKHDEEDYGDRSSRSQKDFHPPNNKITDDDFDTPEIKEGTTRVEVKEKSFPDGTRQVDEITHYADGSKSVKTRKYKD